MRRRPEQSTIIDDVVAGQPQKFLPSYMHRGSIVTNGSHAYLSTINLRIRKQKRFATCLESRVQGQDKVIRRVHVPVPDCRRLLPYMSTAMPNLEVLRTLIPEGAKVDIGAIDTGKEFMVGFACVRSDREGPKFTYTVRVKTRAVYQPSNRRQGEAKGLRHNTVIHSPKGGEARLIPPRLVEDGLLATSQAIALYETKLESLDNDPKNRVKQIWTSEYLQLSSFYNKHNRHQKSEAHSKRATVAEMDISSDRIFKAMGTHLHNRKLGKDEPKRIGIIAIGYDGNSGFSTVSKGHQASLHNTFLKHFLPRVISFLFFLDEYLVQQETNR